MRKTRWKNRSLLELNYSFFAQYLRLRMENSENLSLKSVRNITRFRFDHALRVDIFEIRNFYNLLCDYKIMCMRQMLVVFRGTWCYHRNIYYDDTWIKEYKFLFIHFSSFFHFLFFMIIKFYCIYCSMSF